MSPTVNSHPSIQDNGVAERRHMHSYQEDNLLISQSGSAALGITSGYVIVMNDF